MKLKEYTIGFADAMKELKQSPEIFNLAFYDPKGMIDELKSGYKYMIVGRKGVGKSAVSAKLQSDSERYKEYSTLAIMLNEFNYTIFSKTNANIDVQGTKKYLESWQLILLLTIFKYLNNKEIFAENLKFIETIKLIEEFGFNVHFDMQQYVGYLAKLKSGKNVDKFNLKYEDFFGYAPNDFNEGISNLNRLMINTILDLELDMNHFVLIDGVDDILRLKTSHLEILSSLIRSVDILNERLFNKNNFSIKFLLFIREDILTLISDPDLNKILRDGKISLNWVDNPSDLKQIVELRLRMSNGSGEDSLWDSIYDFPLKRSGKSSWELLLEHTLYKPRDVLQFLEISRELYPNNEKVDYYEMMNTIKKYSSDYLIGEMKNELSGFIPDEAINSLTSVFQKIGTTQFRLDVFLRYMNDQTTRNKSFEISTIKELLLKLFEAGYIGQIMDDAGESVNFKHRNPMTNIDFERQFIIHRGIVRGLGIAQ